MRGIACAHLVTVCGRRIRCLLPEQLFQYVISHQTTCAHAYTRWSCTNCACRTWHLYFHWLFVQLWMGWGRLPHAYVSSLTFFFLSPFLFPFVSSIVLFFSYLCCFTAVTNMQAGITYTSNVTTMTWEYYSFPVTLSGGDLTIELYQTNTGDCDLYVQRNKGTPCSLILFFFLHSSHCFLFPPLLTLFTFPLFSLFPIFVLFQFPHAVTTSTVMSSKRSYGQDVHKCNTSNMVHWGVRVLHLCISNKSNIHR